MSQNLQFFLLVQFVCLALVFYFDVSVYRDVRRNEKQIIANQVSLEMKEKFEHRSSLFNPRSLFLTPFKRYHPTSVNMVFRVNALKSVLLKISLLNEEGVSARSESR